MAGTGSDGIRLVDVKLDDDNIAAVGGGDREKVQLDRNTSLAR